MNLYTCIDCNTTYSDTFTITLTHPHLQQLSLTLPSEGTEPLLVRCRQLSGLILQLLELAKLWVPEGDTQLLHTSLKFHKVDYELLR